MKKIQERFYKVLAKLEFGEGAKPESNFTDDLGMDSLDVVELTMGCEEEFNIEIPDEAALRILTVRDMIAYLELHVPGVH